MSKQTSRRRRSVRAVVLGVIAGAVMAVGVSAATALDSGWKAITSNGVSYRNQSSIFSNNHALTTLQRLDSGAAGVGKMGARARAYWDDGTLCSASQWRYNTASTTIYTNEYVTNCGGYVYAQGQTQTWNGNGYDTVAAKRTPNAGPF